MKDLFDILSELEKDEHIHLGRLLLLLNVFAGDDKLGEVEGLTKLAKLDFLLRYPVYLERALNESGKQMKKSPPLDYERKSVEAKMVRFKYGPWDFRYRRFINTLIGMGLVYIRQGGRSYFLGVTEKGAQKAKDLEMDKSFTDLLERAKTIKTHFNFSGTNLMRFVYRTFPEIGTLQYGKEII
ncbi:MAG: hypothetical protein JST19_13490 [Bacteroidetes bacterium]|nr:hypothetical protein [Bacteroidota bacterium]